MCKPVPLGLYSEPRSIIFMTKSFVNKQKVQKLKILYFKHEIDVRADQGSCKTIIVCSCHISQF